MASPTAAAGGQDGATAASEKLAEYRGQLAEVEVLLQADPTSAEILALRADLKQLIDMSEQLVAQERAEAAAAAAAAAGAGAGQGPPGEPEPGAASAAAATASAPAAQPGTSAAAAGPGGRADDAHRRGGTKPSGAPAEGATARRPAPISSLTGRPIHAKVGEDGFFEIPEKLQILPTDTEVERLRKRKKLKVIKHANKRIAEEKVGESKKASWMSFQKKVAKKKRGAGAAYRPPPSSSGPAGDAGPRSSWKRARYRYKT